MDTKQIEQIYEIIAPFIYKYIDWGAIVAFGSALLYGAKLVFDLANKGIDVARNFIGLLKDLKDLKK